MKFFGAVFFVLGVIAVLNLTQVGVQMAMRDSVYACSEVTKHDPKGVQDICRKVRKRGD